MTLSVTFLGTSGAVPTAARNPSAVFVRRDGDRLLFDCAEGTQRQMMRFSTGFDLNHIFITHTHGDHVLGLPGVLQILGLNIWDELDEWTRARLHDVLEEGGIDSQRLARSGLPAGTDTLESKSEADSDIPYAALGVPGLLQTMDFNDRKDGVTIHTPNGTRRTVQNLVTVTGSRPSYPVRINEVGPGDIALAADEYEVRVFRTDHRATSVGYALVEDERKGRFDRERAEELGVPVGPKFSQLHDGEPVELDDGTVVRPEQVVGEPRPGRTLVYTGDTRPTSATVAAAADADLLIHDATFTNDRRKRAGETGHSTAVEATEIANRANARRLAFTHVSSRYAGHEHDLAAEGKDVFEGQRAFLPDDGDRIEVPYPDE